MPKRELELLRGLTRSGVRDSLGVRTRMSQDLDAASAATPSVGRMTWAVFLISAAGLFLELLLIRWVSTEIRIFAYLQNTVLVVCFLGLGMGCWDARRRPFALRDLLVPLTGLVVLAVSAVHPACARTHHRHVQRVQRPAGLGPERQDRVGAGRPPGRSGWR